jgi:hypothetical protein
MTAAVLGLGMHDRAAHPADIEPEQENQQAQKAD